MIVVVVNNKQKKISSRDAMQITAKTYKSYNDWINNSEKRIPLMIYAIKNKDFVCVGQLAELDCLDMHRCMQESFPSINFWQPETTNIMELVKNLRLNGIDCFFTIDAGPNVKILCLKKDREIIIDNLSCFATVY